MASEKTPPLIQPAADLGSRSRSDLGLLVRPC